MVRTSGRLLTFLALAIGAAVLIPALTAFGHAGYDHSTPNADEVVATSPAKVDVFFKEDLVRSQGQYFVHVFNDQSTQVSDGDGTVDDADRSHISATLQPGLGQGRYIVRWKTVSDADGDEAEGAFCYYVGAQPNSSQSTECAALEATPTSEATTAGTGTPSTAVATTATTPEASPTVAPADNSSDNGSNTGAIVGGIIGGIAAVVVLVGGVAFYMRRSRA
jgi:methionine-rich copper-binding protein CopC